MLFVSYLDGDVHGGSVESFEHDLGHLLSVGLGVEGSLSEKDGVLFWGNSELIVESVMPDLLHIVPVCDDAVLDGVLEGQDTSLGLSFVSDVGVLLAHTDHDTLNLQIKKICKNNCKLARFNFVSSVANSDNRLDNCSVT